MKKRESNYDLLRIICTVAVIAIHISMTYIDAITDDGIFGELYTRGTSTTCTYNVLPRFAVPCFVMMSGAFVLDNIQYAEFRSFYRKAFIKIGIPTLFFSLFYLFYSLVKMSTVIELTGRARTLLLSPLLSFLKGEPFYHMWYMYTIAGVYLLAPIIVLFKDNIDEKTFFRVAWIFFIAASLSMLTSVQTFRYDVGTSFEYTGYFMIGYVIRKSAKDNKKKAKGILFILLGFAVLLFTTLLRYRQAMNGIADTDLALPLLGSASPLIIISSLLIFAGFSHIEIKRDLGKLSALTFPIYLIHAFIWDIISMYVLGFGKTWDNRITIPACIVIVFVMSAVLAKIYSVIWEKAEEKWQVSDKICKLVRL